MHRKHRVWGTFLLVSAIVVGADFAYVQWRGRSLEPLSVPVDLTKSGSYTFDVAGFHASRYHPEFWLDISSETDIYGFSEDTHQKLWHENPPTVRIEVLDRRGRRVLLDEGALTRSNGWIVTGSPGATEVELYKFAEFASDMFGRYRVNLTVLTGSPAAASYQPRFEISAIKAYALLPSVFGFLALVAAVVGTAIVIALIQMVSTRRRGKAQSAESAD